MTGLRPAMAAVLAGFLAAGCAGRAVRPPELLRISYGGAVGETRVWSFEQTLRGEIAFGGIPQLVAVKLKGTVTETVTEALPDGGRRLKQVWTVAEPEINGMGVGPAGSSSPIEVGVLRAPTGETSVLEGGSPGGDLLLWAARTFGGFFPLLPAERVAPGERWSRAETAPAAGGLEVQRVVNAKLDSVEGSKARIGTDGSVSLSKAGPGAPLEEFRLECGGDVVFDLARGVVTSSSQDGLLRLKGRAEKTPVSARARFSSRMTLESDPAR